MVTSINIPVGRRLRQAREAARFTQETLAFEAEVDRSYISLLERGHRCPTVAVLFRLCDAIGIEPATLIANVYEDVKNG